MANRIRQSSPPSDDELFGMKPKDAGIVRSGRSVFLYGPVRFKKNFGPGRRRLGVIAVLSPLKAAGRRQPKTEILFRTWQAAYRFVAEEFAGEEEKNKTLAYPGSCLIRDPRMDRLGVGWE